MQNGRILKFKSVQKFNCYKYYAGALCVSQLHAMSRMREPDVYNFREHSQTNHVDFSVFMIWKRHIDSVSRMFQGPGTRVDSSHKQSTSKFPWQKLCPPVDSLSAQANLVKLGLISSWGTLLNTSYKSLCLSPIGHCKSQAQLLMLLYSSVSCLYQPETRMSYVCGMWP